LKELFCWQLSRVNAPRDIIEVISEAVFTANHLTDTDKQNSIGTQTKYNPEKVNTMQNTAKENYPGSVASYDTRPGNEIGLFYNAPAPIRVCILATCTGWHRKSGHTCTALHVCMLHFFYATLYFTVGLALGDSFILCLSCRSPVEF